MCYYQGHRTQLILTELEDNFYILFYFIFILKILNYIFLDYFVNQLFITYLPRIAPVLDSIIVSESESQVLYFHVWADIKYMSGKQMFLNVCFFKKI